MQSKFRWTKSLRWYLRSYTKITKILTILHFMACTCYITSNMFPVILPGNIMLMYSTVYGFLGRTSEVGKTMLREGTRNIINSMKKNKVDKISVVTSIGTGSRTTRSYVWSHSSLDDWELSITGCRDRWSDLEIGIAMLQALSGSVQTPQIGFLHGGQNFVSLY